MKSPRTGTLEALLRNFELYGCNLSLTNITSFPTAAQHKKQSQDKYRKRSSAAAVHARDKRARGAERKEKRYFWCSEKLRHRGGEKKHV